MGTGGRVHCNESKDFLPSTSSISSTACVLVSKMITKSTEILAIGWQKINEAKNLPMGRKTKQNKASTEKKKGI